MTKSKLTDEQQALFNSIESVLRKEVALEYIKNGYENGTKAYLNACENLNRKPSKNPETSASEILSYPNVLAFINSLKISVAESVHIDASWVLQQMKDIHELDVADILDSQGNFLQIKQWPKTWRMYISGLDIQELNLGDTEAVVKKIKWPDKVKNLEMIGRHVNVKAWDKEEARETPQDIVINFVDAVKPNED